MVMEQNMNHLTGFGIKQTLKQEKEKKKKSSYAHNHTYALLALVWTTSDMATVTVALE